MKIAINSCYGGLYGGFGLSEKAFDLYREKAQNGISYAGDINRADPILIEVIELLGDEADTRFSQLKIVEIPDGVEWEIAEYGGYEHVAEKHRIWG
jgi:hypothetical protein